MTEKEKELVEQEAGKKYSLSGLDRNWIDIPKKYEIKGFKAGAEYGYNLAKQSEQVGREENEWVSVDDRLPPVIDKFQDSELFQLFDNENYSAAIGWYNAIDNRWRISHFQTTSVPINVTHWKPFVEPEPPANPNQDAGEAK